MNGAASSRRAALHERWLGGAGSTAGRRAALTGQSRSIVRLPRRIPQWRSPGRNGARSTSGSRSFVSEGEIDALLGVKVAELKKSADGQGLPVQALRHMLTHSYYDRCPCHAAMVVMEERDK